jgi:hypothetical protein
MTPNNFTETESIKNQKTQLTIEKFTHIQNAYFTYHKPLQEILESTKYELGTFLYNFKYQKFSNPKNKKEQQIIRTTLSEIYDNFNTKFSEFRNNQFFMEIPEDLFRFYREILDITNDSINDSDNETFNASTTKKNITKLHEMAIALTEKNQTQIDKIRNDMPKLHETILNFNIF